VLLAQCSGADGALISVPPYTSPPPADAERYFLDVADATDLPLGTYNNAPRLRTDMDTKSLARILARADYVLHKESTGRVHQVAELLSLAPDVSFMSDDSPEPGLAVQTMALGGSGLCNGAGNLAPRELVTLSTPWREATQSEIFRNEYLRLLPLLQVIYATTSPVAIKTLMAALGMPAGQLRKPLRTPGADFLQSALEVLDSLGLREKYACDF
jgi:4-hydroxy-tetrahydrodipicolinate synthase